MKLLHVMAGAESGGAENIFLESVLALDDAGLSQRVVTRDNNDFRLTQLRDRGMTVDAAAFHPWWRAPTNGAIARAISEYQPDVIEYWMGRAGTFAPASHRSRSIGWYGGYYKIKRFQNCAYHVGLTKDLVRHIREQGAEEGNIGLIHTYAEFPETAPAPRESVQTPEGAPLILALARLHWKKGLDLLLQSVAQLADMPSPPYCWIAGDGPLRADLEAQAQSLGVSDRVRFLGWRDDRAALLAACDVVAFPSRYEPFGTVTVDAWAANRPLVAAKSQGPGAYISHERDGLLVEIDDLSGLTAALRRVISDPDLAARLVDGGRAAYQAQFTKAAFVRDSVAFYEKVVAA